MVRKSISAWIDDFAPSMGAALAYYTMFSIAPTLVIIIAIAGFFLGQEAATGQLYAQIAGLVGDDGAHAIQGLVESASSRSDGIIATIVGLAVLVIGATTVFAELQSDLDRVWKAPAAKKSEGLWALIRSRVLSLGLVVSMGFVLLVSLAISAALSALGSWWGGIFGELEWLLQLVNFVVSFGVITLMFALMYKILPRVRIAWHDVWIGAAVTAALFTIGKLLVGLYLGKSSVASGFGAAGSLVVLLVWVYYSAQIFLLGAEFTWIYAHEFGSRKGQDKPATAKEQGTATGKPAVEGGAAASPGRARDGKSSAPVPAAARTSVPSPAGPRDAAAADPMAARARAARRRPRSATERHAGVIAAAALLLGALASEALRYGQRGIKPRPLQALAGELRRLRALAPRRRMARLPKLFRA
jgi:membrane protein